MGASGSVGSRLSPVVPILASRGQPAPACSRCCAQYHLQPLGNSMDVLCPSHQDAVAICWLSTVTPYFPSGSATACWPIPAPGPLSPIPLLTPMWWAWSLQILMKHIFECKADPVPFPQHSYRTVFFITSQNTNIWGTSLAAMSYSAMAAQCKTHVYANLTHTSSEHNRTQPQHPEHVQKATKLNISEQQQPHKYLTLKKK